MTIAVGPSVYIEAVAMSGRAVVITFKVKRDLVEVFESSARTGVETNIAMVDRDELIRWLAEPRLPLARHDLILEIDYDQDSRGRLAITTKNVLLWTLSPTEEHLFNRHLAYRE